MNRYDSNERFVRPEPSTDSGQWRVVGELASDDAKALTIVDTMTPAAIAPRIHGSREDPLSRGQGFGLISIPFVLVVVVLVAGLTRLAFVGSNFIAWLMTGIGGLALVVLAVVYWINENHSPGAVDRRWAKVEERRHDNDTEVRLAMVSAERDVRLARLQVYKELTVNGGTKSLPTDDRSPRQLSG